ncbi:CHAT domain-containing protein [Frankia sp. CNm7]|uniref:CHAT domain-containing protein n=1 Tax=Frankia nepalensis TaxID=1836974 RepID=UPI00193366B6|nr:CHAT domain-containing protein [Frankia nepalensis]MBL7517311.1 CHAT domain-containing protein [Frankia nepalensis]
MRERLLGQVRSRLETFAVDWKAGRAVYLLGKTMLTGNPSTLNEAIDLLRQAVDATPVDCPDRAGRLSNLGAALSLRYERDGRPADLNDAIGAVQAAVDATPVDQPVRAVDLSNLGNVLRARFEQVGRLADLEAAIAAGQAAVDTVPVDHPGRAGMLSNLGNALNRRFGWGGELADLEAAIAAGQAAVDATPVDQPVRAGRLSNLGDALRVRFERLGELADLEAAIAAGQAAVDATPVGHPDQAVYLSNLGNALHLRFERIGELADLDAAIVAGQAAVDATPVDHPDRAAMLSNLGGALHVRFERVGELADLDAAIVAGQAAVDATPVDYPARAAMLANLGNALGSRFDRDGEPADLDAAISDYRAAVGMGGVAPRVRAGAAHGWGLVAARGGRWLEAVAGYAAATELLGQVAPRSLKRGDQEHLLAELGNLGADAAACCVRAGLIGRAVELFEQGRGVLLGQALDTRTDVTALAEQHPDLAASFIGLCTALDQADDLPGLTQSQVGEDAAATGAERRAAGAAFDDLIARIRGLAGFEGFLHPPPVTELLATATDGPVVVVAVSEFGSYALLLTGGGVEAVPLAGLTPQAVHDQVIALLGALDDTTPALQGRLGEIVGWLWDVLAGPVLDRLDVVGPPRDGGRWPRLWWCTSGLLSFLPVHAAGHHHTRFDPSPATVLDRAIASYTPTIRALAHARRASPLPGGSRVSLQDDGRLVAVAMPHTPDAADLPGAQVETASLQARFSGQVDLLTGPQATRQAVLGRLPTARWAHFACHGTVNLADPSASQLLLADHQTRPLTVLDVARLRLRDAELAFLSACETARPGRRLTDEAIHLASAFQLAGYRHVIATLWPISDRHAVDIANDIYTTLATTGDAAAAVHTATRQLRGLWARHPSVWASHIHVGM